MNRRSFLKGSTAVASAAISQEILRPLVQAEAAQPSANASAELTQSATSPGSSAQTGNILFREDFSRFPPGWLSHPVGQLNGAIQECHYLEYRGVSTAPWANVICHMDAWVSGDEDGKTYVEQHTVNELAALTNPILVTGDILWSDYTVEAKVKPISLAEMAGVVFRYHNNRHYYLFVLTGGKYARLALRSPLEKTLRVAEWQELGKQEFVYETKNYYTLRVENTGPRIRAHVDGKLLIEASSEELMHGKIGLTANIPARFQDFSVTASPETRNQIRHRIDGRDSELAKLREENPQPKLWKKFSTPKFGAGRSVRFGDLNGDGTLEMLIGQNVPRVAGDAHDAISCLTAVTLDGTVVWQQGRPNSANGLLTNDLPFQIHDVDGDGRNEVVLIRDFKLQILEGSTGKLKRWTWMPAPVAAKGMKAVYGIENGDSVAFLNLSGSKDRHEILVKDRYWNFWIFNNNLEFLWRGQGQTGHFPYPFDIDGDGRDEFMIGYALWDHNGRRLWSHDEELYDHADAVFLGNFSADPEAEPRAYAAGSDEGLLIFDQRGQILKHIRIGHAQNASIAKYRPDLPGLQYMLINFWKSPGIVTLFDFDGNILAQEEPTHSGSALVPVNWRGDGQEFALLSGNAREGGMLDGYLRRVVLFPDDGHPELCAHAMDLTGDARDEVILWDQQSVWIYTQDRPFSGERIYAPVRNPHYNESNYRTSISWPAWREPRKKS